MGGKFGTQLLQKLAGDLATVISIVYKLVSGSWLALINTKLIGIATDIFGLNLTEAKNELGELDAEDRTAVEQAFLANLDLPEAVLAKVKLAIPTVDDAFTLFAEAKETVQDALAFVAKVRAIFGL
jgi:hypothetical protein